MQIPHNLLQGKNFYVGSSRPVSSLANLKEVEAIRGQIKVNQSRIETITPQSHHFGNVAQVVSSQYLYELRKDVRKVLRGRKLKEILEYDYSLEEFEELPQSLQNLIAFDRSISSAEILQFMEAFDKSHEITFRDYAFDRIKFRALFEAIGSFVDVEMQAGPNSYIALSDNFEIKRKIKETFIDLKDKIKDKLVFKSQKRRKAPPPKNESRNLSAG